MLMSISKEDGHWYCSKECGGSDVLATHDVGVRQVATPTPTPTPRSTEGAKIQEENLLAAEFEDCVVDLACPPQVGFEQQFVGNMNLMTLMSLSLRDRVT
ncbi:unnamed protein product [Cylindrotheca closterium]|uniref:Uncharacterized protein n=1 Tax=Cylindrotheca closterium TaxID=2856 RepID=A0AAD2CIE6_9STRA|nr:unnamed protein product [Cylindrotheca closterium]